MYHEYFQGHSGRVISKFNFASLFSEVGCKPLLLLTLFLVFELVAFFL